jgi:uncharacterized protein (DUF1697 family)
MNVNEWVYEAIDAAGGKGATLRDVQRHVDDRHHEELAVDTLEQAIDALVRQEKIEALGPDRWVAAQKTAKEDAIRQLFGDDDPASER